MKAQLPRFRGRTFQQGENSWKWQVAITLGDMKPNDPGASIVDSDKGHFPTRPAAKRALDIALVKIINDVTAAYGIKGSKDYGLVDLNTGMPLHQMESI